MKGLTFVDRCRIKVFAGNGGNGAATFRREKFVPKGGPDGGDGGHGGNVYLKATTDESSLLNLYYQPLQRAEHGVRGRSKQMYGRNGEDLYIKVPCGTEVRLEESKEWVGEVLNDGDELLVAHGGKGGLGNMHFATATHQTPTEFTPGQEGEQKTLILELKSVADVGLVGYPNAGKSTLIGALTPAHPKVAPYPFTTLHPVIGTLDYEDYTKIRIADIPGLIDGAHQGVGLGHDFLRHIERTHFLLFVLDMAGIDGRHPADDFQNLKKELGEYSPDLLERPYLVVANKMDEPQAETNLAEFTQRTGEQAFRLSAELGEGVEELKQLLKQKVTGDKP